MHISDRLPHRYPFIFIDKVIEIEEAHKVVTIKMITVSESLFQNRMSTNLVVPWTVIIEAMAQTSGLILGKKSQAVLAELKNISIHGDAYPGDCIKFISEKILNFDKLHYFEVQALVEEKTLIKGNIILAEV